jgi:hypothetical protein
VREKRVVTYEHEGVPVKKLLLIGAAAIVAGGIATTPAVAGLAGNSSFSRQIPVQVPSQASPPQLVDEHGSASDDRPTPSASRHLEPGDDRGASRTSEPGDDRGTSRTSEPGDDRGAGRTSEPGDDRGGATRSQEPGDDSGGHGGEDDSSGGHGSDG